MAVDQQLLNEAPATFEPPINPKPLKAQAPSPKRRAPLTPSEKATIKALAEGGASASEIARQLVDRPIRTVREALLRFAKAGVTSPAASKFRGAATIEPLPTSSTPARRSRPHMPFTQIDRLRIQNLVDSGLSAAQIAARIHRGLPQVSRIVRELAAAAKPARVALKLDLPMTTWDLLEAAARRRRLEPTKLALELLDHLVRHGSIDQVRHAE
jgi:IS30 family transposase